MISSDSALIGFSGFVGSNLLAGGKFNYLYNSKNINEIEGRSFDLVVCAGVSAVKWLANKEPEQDQAAINSLIASLKRTAVKKFVLISTVDVYGDAQSHGESQIPHSVEPYGKHRFALEKFTEETFQDPHIVRLPGLFGPGLKKNVIFDLLNDNLVEKIVPNAHFQWYPVRRLVDDVQTVISQQIPLLNVCSEPISNGEVVERFFPNKKIGVASADAPHYDIRTELAGVLKGRGCYHLTKAVVVDELRRYVEGERL